MPDLTKFVAAGVGPIIVISACGLLCSTFYTRMSNVISRLRAFQRERLAEEIQLSRETSESARERHLELLSHLSTQTDSLMRRVRYLRRTLFCLLATIASLILCSLSLGVSMLVPRFIFASVSMFVVGLLLLLCAIGFAMVDLKLALDPVVLEAAFVTRRLRKIDRV